MIYYKKNNKVYVTATEYLKDYENHPSGNVTITEVVDEKLWHNPLVPEYKIKFYRKQKVYTIPQYSITKEDWK